MATSSIPVDLFNPGQVFACIGLVEAADTLAGNARGAFDWSDPAAVRFTLRADGDADPVASVLGFLAESKLSSLAPFRSVLTTDKWNVPTSMLADGDPYPFHEPDSPATLPACLTASDGRTLVIDHWGDATERDSVKFWAGSGGYPGAALALDALNLVRDRLVAAASDPFALSAPQSSSFRFDWRRDYIPMDVGFSPNAHGSLTMVGFPVVELLAAIGLANARPARPDARDRLQYRYAVIADGGSGELVDPIALRAALGAAELPYPMRHFRMYLGWPGQENQARCITNVVEEAVR